MTQLNHSNIKIPPDRFWFCSVIVTILSTSTGCGTWFILAMTFERFYSIIRPHKAASFNTVKKARVIIVCIIAIRAFYGLPHFFMTIPIGNNCIPFAKNMNNPAGKAFYWVDTFFTGFGFPCVALLVMNSLIIHTLRKRSSLLIARTETQGEGYNEGQGQNQGHSSKMKSSEKQIIIMLLLVTFEFLVLMLPTYGITFYVSFVDFGSSPKKYAGFRLFQSIGQKTYFTNYAINFYLYVISGTKFHSDLTVCGNKRKDLFLRCHL